MENEKKAGVTIGNAETENNGSEPTVEERDFTTEQTQNQLRMNEEDFIQGLIEAAGFATNEDERKRIEIIRNGKVLFAFTIRPLCSEEYDECKKKWTKYVRNKQLGMKLPEDTNRVKYQSAIIHKATIEEDRNNLWDNKKVWNALNNKGLQIMNGLDVIEYCLKAGEKDRVIEEIDRLSGFDIGLEEVAKN